DADACVPEPKFCEQVADNIVIVAGIEGDLIDSAAIDDRSYDIECLVAIERRNFDGDHVWDFREPAPEFVGKHAPSYRGLEVKTDHRNDRSNSARVIEECGNRSVLKCGQAEQGSVVSQRPRELSFSSGLVRFPTDSCDFRDLASAAFFGSEFEHRAKQIELRIANSELSGVDPYSDPCCTRSQVVARECALTALIELTLRRERKRMRRNHQAFSQLSADMHQNFPSWTSK